MFTSGYLQVLMCQVRARPCKQYNELRSMKLYINISLCLLRPPLSFGISRLCIHWESQWMQIDEALSFVSHFLSGRIRMKTEISKTKSKTVNKSLLKSFLGRMQLPLTFIGCFSVLKYCNVDILLSYMFMCVFAYPYITGAGQSGIMDTVVLSLHGMNEGTEAKTSWPSKWEAWENAAIPWL